MSEEDFFRIRKILETYQAKPEITQTGSERRKVIDELVEKYFSLARGKIPRERAGFYREMCFAASGEGLGPLDFFLEDPEVEEIMVNGPGEPIYIVHRTHGICETNVSFESAEYVAEKANQMLFPLNKRVDEGRPVAHGILENGDRVSVALPPLSRKPCIDVRRFTEKPLTIADLAERGMLSFRIAAFLWLVVERGGTNVGVVGNTGAGKTTLLNALLRLVPPHQRIVSVEEIPEVKIPHRQQVRLVGVEHLGLGMDSCIRETLRLRPDRVVVGEVRSPAEALALRDSCLSGQSFGTYFTYHSESPDLAVGRLISQGVSERDCASLNLLVSCRRSENEKFKTVRIVSHVSEISEGGKTIPLFEYDFSTGGWTETFSGKTRVESWLAKSFLKGKKLSAELKKREKILRTFSGESDGEFFSKLWKEKQGR